MSSSSLPIVKLYELIKHGYSAIPYRFFRNGAALPPLHYILELTRRCNLRCQMCQYIDWLKSTPGAEQREGELSTEEWHGVIDQIPGRSLITFTGGEVYVRQDFPELLEHACRSRVHIISNTTMMTEERAQHAVSLAPKRLGGRGLNFVGTSIDAPQERHDTIRQMVGAYDKSVAGVQALVRLRDGSGKRCPLIHVTTVIQKANVDCLHEMPALMKAAGADVLNLVTETRTFDVPNLGEVDPREIRPESIVPPRIERQILSEALRRTEQEAARAGIELRLPRMPRKVLLDYYESSIDLADFECRTAWSALNVGYQGNVYPCFIMKVGSVREEPLNALWNGERMRRFRRACRKGLFPTCPGCCFIEHKRGAAWRRAEK
jgi:radical SAM protein with 4Fe4S-binding SPASM domain